MIWSTAIWYWHFLYIFTLTGYSGKIPSSKFHLQKHDAVNLSTAMSAVYMHVHNVLLIHTYRIVWVTTTLYCSFLSSGGQIPNCMFTLLNAHYSWSQATSTHLSVWISTYLCLSITHIFGKQVWNKIFEQKELWKKRHYSASYHLHLFSSEIF